MSFWTAVVIIVAIIALTELMKSKHRARHGITMDWMGGEVAPDREPLPATEKALQNEVEELRERVKVLERIVTDDARPGNLAREIESLRSKE